MSLRLPAALVVAGSLIVAAGCGDDSPDDTRSAGSASTTTTADADTPASSPGSSGGSEPGSTAPPGRGGGTVPSGPANLVGVVTDRQGDRVLVEEQPDVPDAGRKAWVALDGPVFARGSGGEPTPAAPSDVTVGRRVSAWTGMCAESYPEQCAAEALVIE